MQIIHIVSSVGKINFGIWNAAIFGSVWLREHHRQLSFLWVCSDEQSFEGISIPVVFVGTKSLPEERLSTLLREFNATPLNTVVVTHGCWGSQTKIGEQARTKGFIWVYTPHGMLEPWSMQQKKWKKKIYFSLFEKAMAKKASAIRAVGKIEQIELSRLFQSEIWEIENGVKMPSGFENKPTRDLCFLFMARLHYKKGVLPFVQAWQSTMLESGFRLVIAGPDEGELEKIKPYFGRSIEYAGAVYGAEKERLLRQSHYYVLPSFSEGFPTSVVEAMSYGLIPLISAGCNFPEVFSERLGVQMEPNQESIVHVLTSLKSGSFDQERSKKNYEYVLHNLSEERITEKLMRMYTKLLGTVNIE